MRTLLELLRVIFIMGILGGVGWLIIGNIYSMNGEAKPYSWLGAIAIFVLIFVLYRNKLQFSGWYKGNGRNKLSKKVSITLVLVSVLLIFSPFVLSSLLS
ncbi:hypothetical protein CV093_05370 [Oceanobacillus sp. 143]|uniref:Uncharacterized protein n=1 Tax=Oceanobacillus zhaokaii TaxID=2052660 RepID=A0A345PEB4_9BACI|nr:hypothetical protein [Oceanobacillus zhaokaii]AXI08344.1 hypothetical protein CUC15_05105 [Oceanobacillus zhaokaii]QGS68250.1 hypothetical protein CV093_05370 [Oceanobacillus sp. 143]